MPIPFALPLIDQPVVDEMMDTLTNTGWLTSGPKVIAFEKAIKAFTAAPEVLCVNSWTSGAMLMLRWFGIGPGDEVIITSYTYSATALCVMNIGATPVMVDSQDDFNIDVSKIKAAITDKTKAIIPVDLGGWPCDYDELHKLLELNEVKSLFKAENERQEKLGRPLVLSDAAHSIGATYKGNQAGTLTDVTVFSFHSVKNITCGEGGAICLNLPEPFDNNEEFRFLKAFALNGQTKSAFEKNQVGGWKYDIIDQGLKVNLPDVCAAIGLGQIGRYADELLPERMDLFQYYNQRFTEYSWAVLPPFQSEIKKSSGHLYLLRINGITEEERDEMIHHISQKGIGVNVHYIPMPMLTLFKNKGYRMEDYLQTYENYKAEISLPIYNGLTTSQLNEVVDAVVEAYKAVKEK